MQTTKQLIVEEVGSVDLIHLIISAIKAQLNLSNNPEELLTRQQAAAFLSITLPTLHSFSLSGQIKAYRLGKKVMYKKSELVASLRPFRLS